MERKHWITENAETQRHAYFHQRLDWTLRNIGIQARRRIFPAITTPSQSQHRSVSDFEHLVETIRRFVLLFVFGALCYSCEAFETLLAPPIPSTIVGLFIGLLLSMAFRLQRAGLLAGPGGKPVILPNSVDPAADKRQLAQLQTRIALANFTPSKAPLQAGAIAFTALMMVFPPSHVLVQSLNGYPLPAGVLWTGIAFRFFLLFILFGWFAWIWKASKLADAAIRQEIAIIDASEKTQ